MQLVYGTYNPAKLAVMKRWLAPLSIELLGLSDLAEPPVEAEETGRNPLENARIKAITYQRATGLPTLAADSGLYFDDVPPEMQPGEHARRLEGLRMGDEEMIAHYASLVRSLGGRVTAKYRNGLCIAFAEGHTVECFDDSVASKPFYLVDVPHPRRTKGFPLDSMSIDIESGQYYFDMETERADDDLVRGEGYLNFVRKALEEYSCKGE